MSAEPTLFKDIGDIIDEVAASDSTGVVSTAAAGQVAPPATGGEEEEEDSSEDEMEQGDPEAFVMNQVMGMDSFCVSCSRNGKTNLLMTRIPFFRNVIIMAFSCKHCGFRSSEVQSAEIQDKGTKFELTVSDATDLNRGVIKSDKASVRIPSLDFEIPPGTQAGVYTTVEGLIAKCCDDLEAGQADRAASSPEVAVQVGAFIGKLRSLLDPPNMPFTLVLDDPSGNSFIENPSAPKIDPRLAVSHYFRTEAQNNALGNFAGNAAEGANARAAAAGGGGSGDEEGGDDSVPEPSSAEGDSGTKWMKPGQQYKAGGNIHTRTDRAEASVQLDAKGALAGIVFDSSTTDTAKEVMRFPVDCFSCSTGGETRMCVTDIPHFKEIIIMSFLCDECGFRSVEGDLKRDVIKSDTAMVVIPEIDLELGHGTLGGVYTTVEGLLAMVRDKLVDSNPFAAASVDSVDIVKRSVFMQFLADMNSCIQGERPFTLIITDPMANSFIYSPYAPEVDPRLEHVRYTRSEHENTELGLLDMKTEGYNPEMAAIVEAEEKAAAEALAASGSTNPEPSAATPP